ncbi:MAG: DUF262 domain-containing protein [Gammaproteobacteria bacterium]|nr:DUF262 domain-containing protein [Gammaproteobacteria bacterium]
MEIELREITVEELVEGYNDNGEGGVQGYDSRLDIRPPFQREFVYKDKQRDAVINTVRKDFPLNVMYWATRDDDTFEIIDGQQRTISIAQYVHREFSFDELYFHNLTKDQQRQILHYKLMVYVCSGTESEKLEWFRTINIAGEELYDQELRNAVYAGSWVSSAKDFFSRSNASGYLKGKDYMKGSPIRQDYLETAIKWISDGQIEDYMGQHQHDANAEVLWEHFSSVIDWVKTVFEVYRPKMKGVDWGSLYKNYKDTDLDPKVVEKETEKLVQNEDVTNHSGIYPYILTRKERHLNLRGFHDTVKQRVYEKQSGKCNSCKEPLEVSEMEADHITPWSEGGKTDEENCQILCRDCNRRKSAN